MRTVEARVDVQLLSGRDRFQWRNRVWTVDNVDIKNKYCYVAVDESVEPFRIERGTIIQRWREVPDAADHLETALTRFRTDARVYLRGLIEDRSAQEALVRKLNNPVFFSLDSGSVTRVISADSGRFWGKTIIRMIHHRNGGEVDLNDVSAEEFEAAIRMTMDRMRREISYGPRWSGNAIDTGIEYIKWNAECKQLEFLGELLKPLDRCRENLAKETSESGLDRVG